MRKPNTVQALTDLARVRLSKSFFMRDFLFSDIAAIHGLSNIPDDPDLAIRTGTRLCEDILEPLQDTFGRIAIRSAYRSAEVTGLGTAMMRAKRKGYSCASNADNAGGHIWDMPAADGRIGATACIVVPSFWDAFRETGDWQKLAWWIHDHLPYSGMYFHPEFWAFNISWSDRPARRIGSYPVPTGTLTKLGMANNIGSHEVAWTGIVEVVDGKRRHAGTLNSARGNIIVPVRS